MNHETIQIFTDGASRGNPGNAGAGVQIKGLGEEISLSVFLGTKTNNEAEYLALLTAVNYLLQLREKKGKKVALAGCQLVFKLDSMLVVNQMSNKWKIKDLRMQQLAHQVKKSLTMLNLSATFVYIERELNKQADLLANQAIDLELSLKS